MTKRLQCPPGQNNLIHTLSDADKHLIERHLSPVTLDLGLVIEDPGIPVTRVVFPIAGVGSIIASSGKHIVETCVFGREGMSGISAIVGATHPMSRSIVQVPGYGLSISADVLNELVTDHPSLHHHLLKFVYFLLFQSFQTTVSNARAGMEVRLARWILMCHDRVYGDRFPITHKQLGLMLGVRRAGVTGAMHILEGKGLIRTTRGMITVVDREKLEVEASEFYGRPELEYERLLNR